MPLWKGSFFLWNSDDELFEIRKDFDGQVPARWFLARRYAKVASIK